MVSGGVLDDKTLVALDALEDGGLLDRPLADVSPLLVLLLVLGLLLGVGGLPALLPVVGELLDEVTLDGGGLRADMLAIGCHLMSFGGCWFAGSCKQEAHAGSFPHPARARDASGQAGARTNANCERGRLTVKVASSGLEAEASSAWTLPARMVAAETATAALNFMVKDCFALLLGEEQQEGTRGQRLGWTRLTRGE